MSNNQNMLVSSKYLLLMLAVAMSNFMGFGSYLLLAIGLLFLLFHYDSAKVSASVLPLLLFSCIYFLFTLYYQGLLGAAQIFVCPLLWIVGYNLPEAKRFYTIFAVIAVMAVGMCFHGLANYVYNIVQGVSMFSATKVDVWTGEGAAATGQAAHFTMFLGCLFWLVIVQKRKWIRVTSIGVFLCALLYAIQLGSRSFIVLCLLTAFTGIGVYIMRKGKSKQKIRLLLALCFLVAIIAVVYITDMWGLRTYIEGGYMVRRAAKGQSLGKIFTDTRITLKIEYFKRLFVYPWGGGKVSSEIVGSYEYTGGYAHDLWLDMFDEAGILALVALVIYTIASIYRIVAVRNDSRVLPDEKIALVCYAITVFAQFCVEPIWQGSPMLFLSFVLIDGMMAKYKMHA